MKKSLKKTLTAIVLVVISLVLVVSASAGEILANLSTRETTGNLSQTQLPTAASEYVVGTTYYVNTAATNDIQLKTYAVYYLKPGSSSYTLLDSFTARNFYRWRTTAISFNTAGNWKVKVVITNTANQQGEVVFDIDVKSGTGIGSGRNTYNYCGNTYNVVSNLRSEYILNQNNYSRFINSKGNRGCTAVAMCSSASIYNNRFFDPNGVQWYSAGTVWEYCERLVYNGKTYSGGSYSQSEALRVVAATILNNDRPCIVGVGYGSHVVSVVGVRAGVDINSLSLRDLLILDPNGGNLKTLDSYSRIDTSWAIRVPIKY